MAEIAIPLITLGSMYVISNQDDEKEGFVNMGASPNALPNVIPNPLLIFPKEQALWHLMLEHMQILIKAQINTLSKKFFKE